MMPKSEVKNDPTQGIPLQNNIPACIKLGYWYVKD